MFEEYGVFLTVLSIALVVMWAIGFIARLFTGPVEGDKKIIRFAGGTLLTAFAILIFALVSKWALLFICIILYLLYMLYKFRIIKM